VWDSYAAVEENKRACEYDNFYPQKLYYAHRAEAALMGVERWDIITTMFKFIYNLKKKTAKDCVY